VDQGDAVLACLAYARFQQLPASSVAIALGIEPLRLTAADVAWGRAAGGIGVFVVGHQRPPVFVAGALDRRRRAVKLLIERAGVVDCGTIEDAADAERWVKTRAAREGINLDAGAVRALVDRGGNDLVRLRSALERVTLYAMGQPVITADDVKQVVTPAPDAQEDFGIANAVQDGNAAAALRQLSAALDAGAVPFFLMGQLRWVAEKTPAARVKDAIEAVFRTDLALKSSGGDPRILLERLVVELAGMAGGMRRPWRV